MTTHDRQRVVANGNGAQLYFKTHLVRDSSFPIERGEEVVVYTTSVGIHVVPIRNLPEIAGSTLTLDPPPREAVPIQHRPESAVEAGAVEIDGLDADLESER